MIILSLKSCSNLVKERKNSFELYGYDFMLDCNYNPWIIEVNSSPSMEINTVNNFKLIK